MGVYNSYIGLYLMGDLPAAILSVLAYSEEMARQRIEEELQKPGREKYRQLWVRDGRLVKLKGKTYKVWLHLEEIEDGGEEREISPEHGGPWVGLETEDLEQAVEFCEKHDITLFFNTFGSECGWNEE